MIRRLLLAAGLMASPLLFAASSEWRVNPDGFNPRLTPRLAVTPSGKPYVAYGDPQGRLLVRQPDSSIQTLTAPNAKAAGFVLESFGQRLHAAWLEGRAGSAPVIRLRTLEPGSGWSEAVSLGSASRPLPRIRIAGDAAGQVAVVWLGDAPDEPQPSAETSASETSPNYHLYGRRSVDGGRTWGETSRLTAGYDIGFWPALTMASGRVHLFADARRGGETLIVHAEGDEASGWTQAEPVKAIGGVLLIEAVEAGGEPLVVWFGSHGSGNRLESAVRAQGEWKSYAFPGSEAYDIGSLSLAARGEHVYLAFSARGAQQTSQPRKNHVYFTRSSDGGLSWEPIRPFRHYPFAVTQDTFPQMALGLDGNPVLAWNDYRNLRGDLYYNRSVDAGATWLDQDIPVDDPGRFEDQLFPFVDNLRSSDSGFWLIGSRYRTDDLAGADLYLYSLSAEPPSPGKKEPGAAQGEARLEARVTDFWGALVKADYEKAYALFDPYFRRRMPVTQYVGQSGRVKQLDFNVLDTNIEGRVARVAVELTYEIPELRFPRGGTYSRPPTRTRLEETWIFIDGDWYKEYRNEIGDFSFTRY
ncbi:sialidase family protein [Imhoffiella purpurea]|uniref:Sialidase domain-containing protein n=1 Tax=Imhoffiella purpurea TaxID=1249627 RepID=W9W1N3_9GAMM|nr:sialidase family protein [Imhoffiella purpurea]EXJ16520.1 hypothetical protein D779_0121 [Imhoffiella purpurea]